MAFFFYTTKPSLWENEANRDKTVNDPAITSSEGVELEKGRQQIKIFFKEGGFRFYSFDLKKL